MRAWFRVRAVLLAALALLPACGLGSVPLVGALSGECSLSGGGQGAGMSGREWAFAYDVLARTNAERQARGLAPVEWSAPAAEAAYLHSVDMASRGYFDHASPEGRTVANRLQDQGVLWLWVGENLSRGSGRCDPRGVMEAWLDSPTHRDTLLHPLWSHLGVGVHFGPGGPYWTQVFYRQVELDVPQAE
jgi:uncharacterized protein YkwD